MTTDLRFLDAIGGRPFDNAVLAGQFQPQVIRAGLTMDARWDHPEGHQFFSGARITDEDLRAWR